MLGRDSATARTAAPPPSTTVFIGSIPFDATEQQIQEVFQTVGPVKNLRLVSDKETGRPKGIAFCEYFDQASADSAVRNLNGHELSGRQLRVGFAEEHQQMREIRSRADRERDRDFRDRRGERDRVPVGPGSMPVGAATATTAASHMAAMLGGPPTQGPAQVHVNSVLGGMSPAQLHELMSQMRGLIQQNPAQARQTLISNPQLTKALFQAQILLGMVKPPPGLTLPPPGGAPAPAPAPAPAILAPGAVALPAGATQVFSIPGATGGPVQVVAMVDGQFVLQPSVPGPAVPLAAPAVLAAPPAALPVPALPVQPVVVAPPQPQQPVIVAAPVQAAPLAADQQAILAQVMRMTQEQIDALPEATRQQVMQVKMLLAGAAGAAS